MSSTDVNRAAAAVLANQDTRWRIVGSLLSSTGINPQLESYEYFMNVDLPRIIRDRSTCIIDDTKNRRRHIIKFIDVTVRSPQKKCVDGSTIDLMPREAILDGISYMCTILVDAQHDIEYYESDDFEGEPTDTHTTFYRNVHLCEVPCLVGSSFCHTHNTLSDISDPAGYFLVTTSGSGAHKIFSAVQKLRKNWGVIKKSGQNSTECEIRSGVETRFRSTSTLYIRASCAQGSAKRLSKIDVEIPFILKKSKKSYPVPLPCLLKLLHCTSFEQQMKYMVPDSSIDPLVKETIRRALLVPEAMLSRDQIFTKLALEGAAASKATNLQGRKVFIQHILTNELLPHLGRKGIGASSRVNDATALEEVKEGGSRRWTGRVQQGETATESEIRLECAKKCIFIGHNVVRLIYVHLDLAEPCNRDDFSNKRLEMLGQLLPFQIRMLFRASLRQFTSFLSQKIERRPSVRDIITQKFSTISHTILDLIRRGAWSRDAQRTGVVQTLSGQSPMGLMAFQRRIMMTLRKESKDVRPRQVSPSQWGNVCVSESPEGQPCGLVTALALYARVSIGVSTKDMTKALLTIFDTLIHTFDVPRPAAENETLIYVNGRIIGYTTDPHLLRRKILRARRSRDICHETRCVWHENVPFMRKHFFVNTECSVVMRPVFIVEHLHRVPDILNTVGANAALVDALMDAHCVEYIDIEESRASKYVIAETFQDVLAHPDIAYTHVELDPTCILGTMAGIVPFAHMDQAPRITYETSMYRQAISLRAFDMYSCADVNFFTITNLQKSLVRTKIQEYYNKIFGGINTGQILMVAVMNSRDNIEDSVIFNRAALERGCSKIFVYKQYYTDIRKSESEILTRPPPNCMLLHHANYNTVGANGLPKVGQKVQPGDCLIGKIARCEIISPETGMQTEAYIDRSFVLSEKDPCGIVDSVVCRESSENSIRVRIRIRRCENNGIGNKMASRHAQKGVVGAVYDQIDMPFISSGPMAGTCPDLIMSSCAFPSRMTIGQLAEGLHSKVALCEGKVHDATAFEPPMLEETKRVLASYGFHPSGKEKMRNGRTGRELDCMIFCTPIEMNRLHHIASIKAASRNTGPNTLRERQPVEGRSKGGGQRFGEMEKSALITHGASFSTRNRLSIASDARKVVFCNKCGHIARHKESERFGTSKKVNTPWCHNCRSAEHVNTILMPHGATLFLRELNAAQLACRVRNLE